ncbi:hypothetical protein [Rickettsia endosymbiont of Polydrusus tereticollis]
MTLSHATIPPRNGYFGDFSNHAGDIVLFTQWRSTNNNLIKVC